jgi:hypothetical protein
MDMTPTCLLRFEKFMNRFVLASLALVSFVAVTSSAAAQARPTVPMDERVYRDIDRLAAAGLIDTLVLGARPFSEREVVRLLTEAQRNLNRNADAQTWATPTIAGDLARWAIEENRPIDAVSGEVAELHSPYRPIPPDGNGSIQATINPLAANRSGRTLADGFTAEAQTFHSATLGSHIALWANPRLTTQSPRSGGSSTDLTLQTAAANFLFGNTSIVVGRDYAIFGQAPTGGLLLSENAPALDMVRVSNDAPFTLPWWFHAAGPIRATLLVADLGEHDQIHPHSKLIAYHVAALPVKQLEVGLEVIDAMGGNGGQPASFGDRVLDAVPIFDVLRSHSDFQFSNKMAGVDFHWRVPSWSGFELYGQTAVDDFDARRLKSVFLEDGGYIVGTTLSCITECGRLGVRAEYRQTGIRYYTHGDYFIAEHDNLLGDPLGPRGLGGYLTIDGENRAGVYGALSGAFEVRSGNSYEGGSTDATTSDFHFTQTAHRPGEKRARVTGTVSTSHGADRVSLRATAGLEHVTNFGFVAGESRNNLLTTLAIVVRP